MSGRGRVRKRQKLPLTAASMNEWINSIHPILLFLSSRRSNSWTLYNNIHFPIHSGVLWLRISGLDKLVKANEKTESSEPRENSLGAADVLTIVIQCEFWGDAIVPYCIIMFDKLGWKRSVSKLHALRKWKNRYRDDAFRGLGQTSELVVGAQNRWPIHPHSTELIFTPRISILILSMSVLCWN